MERESLLSTKYADLHINLPVDRQLTGEGDKLYIPANFIED